MPGAACCRHRCCHAVLVIATALPVTLTQLVLPFVVDGGLADSTILWGFCVALGMAYMLNRDILRPAPATEP